MIAEIHGKISRTGGNLSDRLEDQLTGDIFGALRYLPFQEGIGPLLQAAHIEELSALAAACKLDAWADCLSFWPYHREGELDALIQTGDLVVGIEVKYHSGLSSDDEVENQETGEAEAWEQSCNQLARESRIVRELAGDTRFPALIFIADEAACVSVCQDVGRRNILAQGVRVGFLSWQEILLVLEGLYNEDPFRACVLADMAALLKRKGFARFAEFDPMGDRPVRPDLFFRYAHREKAGFHFQTELMVEGDKYYEYR